MLALATSASRERNKGRGKREKVMECEEWSRIGGQGLSEREREREVLA